MRVVRQSDDQGAIDRQHPSDTSRPEVMIGSSIAFLFFVLLLGWSAVASLDSGTIAPGEVAVSGSSQAVQHPQGGVVNTLVVREGDSVERGQVLLTLLDGETAATERGVSGQIFALLAQRSRVIAERNGGSQVPPPPEFTGLRGDDLALAKAALRNQQEQLSARRGGRANGRAILHQRSLQLNEQILGLERQVEANLEQQELIQEELTGMRTLAEKGYAPQTRVRALERAASELRGTLGSLRSQIARSREAVGETRLQISNIDSGTLEDVAEQLRDIDVRLSELEPRRTALRAQVARSEIRAPVSGQVVSLAVSTIGGVVEPGQVIMEIVPANGARIIVARVDPNDVDNLREGQEAEVRFPGLRDRNLPTLRGRLSQISASSVRDNPSGASYFRVEVSLATGELAKLGRGAMRLRPGTPAEVVVLKEKRSLLEYLFEPLTDAIWSVRAE